MEKEDRTQSMRHQGPPPGILALIFTLLFNIGLYFVISFSVNQPHFPGPWEPADVITPYFQAHSSSVIMCALFQFGSAIPLGLFTAVMLSLLRFQGVRAAGSYIAFFGGLFAAFNVALAALVLWVMASPGIAQTSSVVPALYYLVFAIGGVGYSVPLGLLMAGLSVSAGLAKLLPKWLVWLGIVLAVCGEASWLSMIYPKLMFLIPLTRFPGFVWLIATGFVFPKVRRVDPAT